MKHYALITVALAALTACGDDGGSGGGAAPVEHEGTQTQSVETGKRTAALAELPMGADQSMAQGPISQVGNQIQAMVGQYQQYRATQQAGLTAGIGQLTQAQATEGDVQWDGTNLSVDVVYNTPQASIHYVVALALTDNDLGGKTIDGTFDLDFATSQVQYDVQYDYAAAYDAVALDAAGCPVSGTLRVDYAFTLGGSAFEQLPPAARQQIANGAGGNGMIAATFGPTCGEVSVAGN